MNNRSSNNLSFARRLRKDQTYVENILWQRLRSKQILGVKFRRQEPIGRYIVDFVNLENKLIVELDGGQHTQEIDRQRTEWLEYQGYRIMRFWDNEVTSNIEGVLELIACALTLTLSRRARETK